MIINSISFLDERPEVTYRDIKIPSFPFPWNKDKVYPELTDYHKDIMRREVMKLTSNDGSKVDLVITMLEGEKKFDANLFNETEFVKAKFRFNFYDGRHQPFLYSHETSGWFEVTSGDASEEFIEQLYHKVLRGCVHKCFQGIQEIHEKENNEPDQSETNNTF